MKGALRWVVALALCASCKDGDSQCPPPNMGVAIQVLSSVDAAAASAPASTRCTDLFVGPGDTADQCLTIVGGCADGNSYAVTCTHGACLCIRDAMVIAEWDDAAGACGVSVGEVGALCGWDLSKGSMH